MENATKALLIAGGVLISMIIISMFYMIFGHMSQMVNDASEDAEKKELIAFNSKFEAYNKKIMYGIDIVSVINMAVDNNIQYGLSQNYDENLNLNKDFVDYYVNVRFNYYNVGTFELKNNYPEIKNSVLNIAMMPAEDRIAGKSAGNVDCDHFIQYLQQKDYKCTKIVYTTKADIIRNTGAIGRVREIVFEPR